MPSSSIEIRTPDGVADAYLTQPEGEERHPGVLFIVDAFGLRPRIQEMADHIAAQGYAVLAPNIFYRDGRAPVLPFPDMTDPEVRGRFMDDLRPIAGRLTPAAVSSDGAAYLDELEKVSDGPFAITGYCMGGRIGWGIAGALPARVAALAGFHVGRLATDDPDSPHLEAGKLQAEVYFGHADHDGSMTPDNVAAIDAEMDRAGVRHRTEVYAGANHGYTMADTPMYDEAATERAYGALFKLLERTLA